MEPSLPRPSYNNPKTLHIRLKIDLRATNDKTSARLYQLVPKTNLRGCTNWVPKIGKTDLTFEMLRRWFGVNTSIPHFPLDQHNVYIPCRK